MWFDEAKKLISQVEGDIGFLVKNLKTGETFSHNSDMVFPSASTIKVYVLLALADEAAAKRMDMNEVLPSSPGNVGGCGIIDYLSDKLPFTLRDYAVFMITISDNAATNILITAIGLETINANIQSLGAKDTVLGRKLMDFEAMKLGKQNLTTCEDLLKAFAHMQNDTEKYADVLKILGHQQLQEMLPAYIPGIGEKVIFPHKTGELSGVRHDVGIMYVNDEPIFICFLSKGLKCNVDGVRLANDLGFMVYNHFKG